MLHLMSVSDAARATGNRGIYYTYKERGLCMSTQRASITLVQRHTGFFLHTCIVHVYIQVYIHVYTSVTGTNPYGIS